MNYSRKNTISQQKNDGQSYSLGITQSSGLDGQDLQILIEADYLANATENGYGRENAENFLRRIARTESGKRLIRSVLCP